MANRLNITQATYSKIERNDKCVNFERLGEISKVWKIEPMSFLNFNDELIFNSCEQSGKFETINNYFPE